MASIERTAYPRFPRLLTTLDLQRFFSPTPDELGWVDKPARGTTQRLALMVQLKCFQYLHHFAAVDQIPPEVPRATPRNRPLEVPAPASARKVS